MSISANHPLETPLYHPTLWPQQYLWSIDIWYWGLRAWPLVVMKPWTVPYIYEFMNSPSHHGMMYGNGSAKYKIQLQEKLVLLILFLKELDP